MWLIKLANMVWWLDSQFYSVVSYFFRSNGSNLTTQLPMESRPHQSKSGYLREIETICVSLPKMASKSWNGLVTPQDIIKPTGLKTDMSCICSPASNTVMGTQQTVWKLNILRFPFGFGVNSRVKGNNYNTDHNLTLLYWDIYTCFFLLSINSP